MKMPRTQITDVLVIGAGPGGSSAAYWLARAGVNVLLCDKATFPRDKPCGDGLTPRAMDELERLGARPSVQMHGRQFREVMVEAGETTERFPLHQVSAGVPRYGWVIRRRELDEMLLQHSLDAGARFLAGITARAIERCADGTLNVLGTTAAGTVSIQARRILIATGANRLMAQSAGLIGSRAPQAFAMRGYVHGPDGFFDAPQVIFDRDIAPGYAWIFPLGDGVANVGVGLAGTAINDDGNARMRQAFVRLLQHPRLAGCHLAGKPQGYPLRTDFATMPVCADNVILVGEAAGLVDPLTGEGIGLALESGRLAAKAVQLSLTDESASEHHLSSYAETLRRRYETYFTDARDLLVRLSHPQVTGALIHMGMRHHQIRTAVQAALLEERPRQSVQALTEALQTAPSAALAQAVFRLSAYTPLIERCREYMLKQVMRDSPADAITNFVRRGKMLRALLVFLGCEAAGGSADHVLAGAGGIELVHAASLVHDDIMDRAETRRGLPALHKTLGASRAVVAGDYLIAKAFRLLAESRESTPPANVVEAFIIGAESGVQACRGQFADVGVWNNSTLSVQSYLEMVEGKTASIIAGALRAGAALAGADACLLDRLGMYGKSAGIAFQIRDDLLDFRSADAIASMDRKPSLPLVLAFDLAKLRGDDQGCNLVLDFLASKAVCASKLHDWVIASGMLTEAEGLARNWAQTAIHCANEIPHVGDMLTSFAHYAILREE